jgi:hypothetical protein
MGIEMNMISYEIERSLMEAEYGDEVMCAGWIPAVAQMCQLQPFESTNKLSSIPTALAAVNAVLFMQRMYAYQR